MTISKSAPGREILTAARDYYVRRDGNDSNSGLANTSGGAFLTINHALDIVCLKLDLNGQTVQIRVQGANVGDGTYTENILTRDWIGYSGNGFNQLTVLGENGTATITGSSAGATLLAACAETPIRWKNLTIGNANNNSVGVEADDGGLMVLDTITFGTFGTGAIAILAVVSSGRVLMMAGTHTFSANVNTGIYARSKGSVILQPGVTFALGTGRVFGNALVDIAGLARFQNSSLTVTGTLGSSSVPLRIDVGSFADVDDLAVLTGISGAGAAIGNPPNNAWQTFTSTVTSGAGTLTTASGTVRYQRIGKTIFVNIGIFITTNGTGSAFLSATLPGNAQGNSILIGKQATANKSLQGITAGSSNSLTIQFYDGTYPGADGVSIFLSGVYEEA